MGSGIGGGSGELESIEGRGRCLRDAAARSGRAFHPRGAKQAAVPGLAFPLTRIAKDGKTLKSKTNN